jgi:hypothetical protein
MMRMMMRTMMMRTMMTKKRKRKRLILDHCPSVNEKKKS